MKIPNVLSNDDGIRPAGNQDECFYCNQKIGTPHKLDCIILNRKVKVRYTFDIEIEVPWSWNKYDIEFNRNDGSWCADNSIKELTQAMYEKNIKNNCLCNDFNCEVLEIPDKTPYRYKKNGKNNLLKYLKKKYEGE